MTPFWQVASEFPRVATQLFSRPASHVSALVRQPSLVLKLKAPAHQLPTANVLHDDPVGVGSVEVVLVGLTVLVGLVLVDELVELLEKLLDVLDEVVEIVGEVVLLATVDDEVGDETAPPIVFMFD